MTISLHQNSNRWLNSIAAQVQIYDQGSSNDAWGYACASAVEVSRFLQCGCGHTGPAIDVKMTACVDCAAKMRNPPMIVDKQGRNSPCHCGSGKKFKQCCIDRSIGATGL